MEETKGDLADGSAAGMTDSDTLTQDVASSLTGLSSQSTKGNKNFSMYHHKQKHIHRPHHKELNPHSHAHAQTHVHAHAASNDELEMQNLYFDEGADDAWDDPIRYVTSHEVGFSLFGLRMTWSGVRCIRSVRIKLEQTNGEGEVEEYEGWGHWSMFGMLIHKKQYHEEAKKSGQDRYLVVGRMSTNGYVIREKMVRYPEHDEKQMLRQLHSAIRSVRGMRGMFFSLKRVSGFGLYQCDPSAGHHTRAILRENQRASLRSFYNSYNWRIDPGAEEFLWNDWVFKHINNSSKSPMEGKYSIEVLLSWSVQRLAIVTSMPVILSLAIGFWYQSMTAEDGSDPIGTAWIIGTYIITAGALIIAFLGVATSLEQS